MSDQPRDSGTSAPACSAELWRVRQDPMCQPIWNHADSLPLSELTKALEIMRLCALLYVQLHKPNAGREGTGNQ